MAYPYTDTGYNMFDMLSMIQKAIRRGDYENAGFAAAQLKGSFRAAMWNRMLVISAEDCFGTITKELVALKKKDDAFPSDQTISNSVALLCRSKKSRDACYFACNFVLASRCPREIYPTQKSVEELLERIAEGTGRVGENGAGDFGIEYDRSGFHQMSLFDYGNRHDHYAKSIETGEYEINASGVSLQIALKHRDMDMIGYEMNALRHRNREFLWNVFLDYASCLVTSPVKTEIEALKEADNIVNKKKSEKDEIFISKAAVLLCHCEDPEIGDVTPCDIVNLGHCIDWSAIRVKPMEECRLAGEEIPEWVYDCHTLKGKKMGKTDWDMTVTEQAALYPLQIGYFDDASWLYAYEQDLEKGMITQEQMIPILDYAKSHPVNPVKYIPYNARLNISTSRNVT